ncbi:hypothetical protein PQR37_18840 [Paraburkholderia nemoris]|uniref:hypothetical protein n=1 Tax=Paraburkholderia nemoris TaxID=2793076 RepID=UPI0038BA8308
MLPQLAEILQDTLNLTRYAAAPFVLNGRPDSVRQWFETLRDRLTALTAKTTAALASLDRAGADDCEGWTSDERILSHNWVTKNYPNESDEMQAALRKAWRDGQRLRVQRPDGAPATTDEQFQRLALAALRSLAPRDERNREWCYAADDFLKGLAPVRPYRYLAINRVAIHDIFMRHGVHTSMPLPGLPDGVYEAAEELLDHAAELDEYRTAFQNVSRELALVREALNIPNDFIGVTEGTDLLLETIAQIKRLRK